MGTAGVVGDYPAVDIRVRQCRDGRGQREGVLPSSGSIRLRGEAGSGTGPARGGRVSSGK